MLSGLLLVLCYLGVLYPYGYYYDLLRYLVSLGARPAIVPLWLTAPFLLRYLLFLRLSSP